ncbi:transposase [Propionivibrio sp.]|uniref:transposase n=1 Tax=Propionivibrio sp. TaxID=2212460 RepID=UPI003BF278E1
MPRLPRLKLPNTPLHIIQRGNNRAACFGADEDYLFYLEHLTAISAKVGVAIHAYVLMTNHVHLLATPQNAEGVSQLMKRLGQRYVQYFNRAYRRTGTLWEGRFRSCVVGEEAYFLGCQRYIELNPVRAEMVKHPGEYRWSSYGANGQGDASPTIRPHPVYGGLGLTDGERQAAYRELFRHELDPGLVDEIRRATHGGMVLGSEHFAQEVALLAGRRTQRGKAGRPFKQPAEE